MKRKSMPTTGRSAIAFAAVIALLQGRAPALAQYAAVNVDPLSIDRSTALAIE